MVERIGDSFVTVCNSVAVGRTAVPAVKERPRKCLANEAGDVTAEFSGSLHFQIH